MAEKDNEDLNETNGNEQRIENMDTMNENSESINKDDNEAAEVKMQTLEEQYTELNNKYVRLY